MSVIEYEEQKDEWSGVNNRQLKAVNKASNSFSTVTTVDTHANQMQVLCIEKSLNQTGISAQLMIISYAM